MKPNIMVYLIVVFGLMVSFLIPRLFMIDFSDSSDSTLESDDSDLLAMATPITNGVNTDSYIVPVVAQGDISEPIVYDNLTMNQLVFKLNKSLKSNLSGTGNLFAKYCLENGVDPYLAVAIVLHETGCNYSCSSAVKYKNNVGGMMANGKLVSFGSLDDGIKSFVVNLKKKYYDYGLNTPELMNKKYAANPNWYVKINNYISKVKQA